MLIDTWTPFYIRNAGKNLCSAGRAYSSKFWRETRGEAGKYSV